MDYLRRGVEDLVVSSFSEDGKHPGNDNISVVFVEFGMKTALPDGEEVCQTKKEIANKECFSCFPECDGAFTCEK